MLLRGQTPPTAKLKGSMRCREESPRNSKKWRREGGAGQGGITSQSDRVRLRRLVSWGRWNNVVREWGEGETGRLRVRGGPGSE